jgi:hypothetical protein
MLFLLYYFAKNMDALGTYEIALDRKVQAPSLKSKLMVLTKMRAFFMRYFEVSWFSCQKVFRNWGYVLTKILKGSSYNYSTTLKGRSLGLEGNRMMYAFAPM